MRKETKLLMQSHDSPQRAHRGAEKKASPWLKVLALLTALILLTIQRYPGRAQSPAAHRVEIPFTRAIVTPHIPWGIPSAGPPLHAFVVPSIEEGRTLIELAERVPLDYHTVMIDTGWGVNTYIGMDQDYEARTYKVVYQYLADDLTAPADYDVIVIPSLLGWNRLPAAAREAIRKRVEDGAGLVLIHPTTGVPSPASRIFLFRLMN